MWNVKLYVLIKKQHVKIINNTAQNSFCVEEFNLLYGKVKNVRHINSMGQWKVLKFIFVFLTVA